MGKGSNARPIEVPRDEFVGRWDLIFGKKDIKEESKEVKEQLKDLEELPKAK